MTTVDDSIVSAAGRRGEAKPSWATTSSEGERRLLSLLELSCDWFWEMDESLRFTSVKRTNYGKLTLKDEEVLGHRRW